MGRLCRHGSEHSVTFGNPTTGEPVRGRIVDEVWGVEPEEFSEVAPENYGWREAAFVAQLIEWQPDNYRSVRITYYLRPEGGGPNTWYFGGQYAPSMSLDDFGSLMRKLGAKNW